MKPLILYHDNCADGFGAAFSAWLKFGDEAEYLPMNYNDIDTHLEYTGRDLYILDFSFPREVMKHMMANATKVVWLDHHKTAFERWCGGIPESGVWTSAAFAHEDPHHIVLDNNKSGAMLVWEYFHPGAPVPQFIQFIDDRDRWVFQYPETEAFSEALFAERPWTFEQWDIRFSFWCGETQDQRWCWREDTEGVEYLVRNGNVLLKAKAAAIEGMLPNARRCELPLFNTADFCKPRHDRAYFVGLALNTNSYICDVGHELAVKSGTYGLVWYVDENLVVRCSLRSNGDYDVSAIAKAFGGGGHCNAAGFKTDLDTLAGWLA